MKRKSHKKSRRGCIPCKRAHNKCDEQQPNCFNCIRLSRDCAWPEPKDGTSRTQTQTAPPQSSRELPSITTTPSDASIPSSISPNDSLGLPIRELTLLHHYMSDATNTTGEQSSFSARAGIWSQTVVKLGLEYPFLLCAVLSVSALKLAQAESSHEWVVESAKHMDAGLKAFRPLFAAADLAADARLQSALFAFSSLLVVQNFGLAIVEKPIDPIEEFIKCMRLVRGVRVVLGNAWEIVRKAELAPLILGASFDEQPHDAPKDMFLSSLKILIEQSIALPEEDANALTESLDHLMAISAEHSMLQSAISTSQQSSIAIGLTWPGKLSERTLELMAERNPYALCLMTYFPSILVSAGQHWWVKGWDRLLFDAVGPALPREMALELMRIVRGKFGNDVDVPPFLTELLKHNSP